MPKVPVITSKREAQVWAGPYPEPSLPEFSRETEPTERFIFTV